jgi:large subunit ribosomal protein L2
VITASQAEVKVGNTMPLANIPPGIPIYNVEFRKGASGRIARAAGNSCVIMAKEGDFAQVKMPSGEVRMIGLDCLATIGQVGNIEHETVSIGKAGRSRWMGRRPYSRGVAKNPHDHPMGGGEGKASGGLPRTPWGKYTRGLKTRKRRQSDRYILKRRR